MKTSSMFQPWQCYLRAPCAYVQTLPSVPVMPMSFWATDREQDIVRTIIRRCAA